MPCNYPNEDPCVACDCESASTESRGYSFTDDPHWQEFVATYEPVIIKIALKFCSADESLREDVMQEARIALATLRPEECRDYEPYCRGEISEGQWNDRLDRYCRNAIRNSILSYLDSYAKGNWYIGRTRSVKDKKTGATRKVYLPPRFTSLDEMVDDYGMQVDEDANISWTQASEDGLDSRHGDGNNHRWFLPVEMPTPTEETE